VSSQEAFRKLQELRDDPSVSPRLFELLAAIVERLEGPFDASEVPTRPEPRKQSSGSMPAPKLCPACRQPMRARGACAHEFHSLKDSQSLSETLKTIFAEGKGDPPTGR
jgi:hypothetical protein